MIALTNVHTLLAVPDHGHPGSPEAVTSTSPRFAAACRRNRTVRRNGNAVGSGAATNDRHSRFTNPPPKHPTANACFIFVILG